MLLPNHMTSNLDNQMCQNADNLMMSDWLQSNLQQSSHLLAPTEP